MKKRQKKKNNKRLRNERFERLRSISKEIGNFIGVLMLGTAVVDAFIPLMILNNFIQKSRASASEILEILQIEPLKICIDSKETNGSDVEFKNVKFKYNGRDKFAILNRAKQNFV